jgi:hypothetical protein
MSKEEAQRIIKNKVLLLENDGINEFPLETVLIDTFEISNRTFHSETLYLLGLCRKHNHRDISCDTVCQSYFVQIDLFFYFASTLLGAFQIIEALRVLKDHKRDAQSIAEGTIFFY